MALGGVNEGESNMAVQIRAEFGYSRVAMGGVNERELLHGRVHQGTVGEVEWMSMRQSQTWHHPLGKSWGWLSCN